MCPGWLCGALCVLGSVVETDCLLNMTLKGDWLVSLKYNRLMVALVLTARHITLCSRFHHNKAGTKVSLVSGRIFTRERDGLSDHPTQTETLHKGGEAWTKAHWKIRVNGAYTVFSVYLAMCLCWSWSLLLSQLVTGWLYLFFTSPGINTNRVRCHTVTVCQGFYHKQSVQRIFFRLIVFAHWNIEIILQLKQNV